MRSALTAFTALCVGSLLTGGCNKSSAPIPNPPPAPTPMTWSLKLQSKCDGNTAEDGSAITEDLCVARYGFSVLTDGKYQMGPGPQGELRTGNLTEDEKNKINAALASTLKAESLQPESHQTIEGGGTNDIITLSRGASSAAALIRTEGTDLTYLTQSAEQAKVLLDEMRKLAKVYYLTPFPDTCLDGANSVRNLFASMQTCATNTDCVYLDESFDRLESNSGSELTTDNCTLIRPLTVANASLVETNKTKLTEAYNQVQTACAEKPEAIMRAGCNENTVFTLSGRMPVCQQGVCQIPTQ